MRDEAIFSMLDVGSPARNLRSCIYVGADQSGNQQIFYSAARLLEPR